MEIKKIKELTPLEMHYHISYTLQVLEKPLRFSILQYLHRTIHVYLLRKNWKTIKIPLPYLPRGLIPRLRKILFVFGSCNSLNFGNHKFSDKQEDKYNDTQENLGCSEIIAIEPKTGVF